MTQVQSPAAPDASTEKTLPVAARKIPAPRSISEQARAILENYYSAPPAPPPHADDIEGWKLYIDAQQAPMLPVAEAFLAAPGVTVEERVMGGAKVYEARPDHIGAGGPRAHYHIHGGAWTLFAGKICAALAKLNATSMGVVTYGVDYRMPPAHPFPAALDDCVSGYRALLELYPAREILVSGGSAGGNLAAALMLRARDEGLPAPRALFLDTPAVDLTAGSDTARTLNGIDPIITTETLTHAGALYAAGGDLAHPYISPINGDLSRGFPPTYLKTGTRDLLLSDTARMHAALRKAGVEADLYVGEAMPHGGFSLPTLGVPEDKDALADLQRWIKRQFS